MNKMPLLARFSMLMIVIAFVASLLYLPTYSISAAVATKHSATLVCAQKDFFAKTLGESIENIGKLAAWLSLMQTVFAVIVYLSARAAINKCPADGARS